MPLPQDAIIRF